MRDQVDLILTNCHAVLPGQVVPATVHVRDGVIAAIDSGRSHLHAAEDLGGNYLIPGLVEIHTDNLERHLQPRSRRWPGLSALIAHDAQIAGVGITTVLDAICIGVDLDFRGEARDFLNDSIRALDLAWNQRSLRAEHFLHYRCELPHPDLLSQFASAAHAERLRLVSLMDHTPGQRQTVDLQGLRRAFEKMGPVSDEWFDRMVAREREKQARNAEPNRAALSALVRERGVALASHDDATEDDVRQAVAEGATISEFPTTLEAARCARRMGIANVMGAPNVVLGGSSAGNVSARELARAGLLDLMSSDYAPVSLLEAAFLLAKEEAIALPDAVQMVTRTPARLCGLDDRGEISAGRRADLVEVELIGDTPRARRVWRQGERIA
jgi:alpha-D-ribose 1-methylphosphonate 5-triphosphate diphosphatase